MKFKLNKVLIFRLGSAHVINSRLMYNNLKKDDYARQHTTLLGKRALRHLLCFAIAAACAIWLISSMFSLAYQGKILLAILAVVGGIYVAAYGILFLPLAINLTVKQLRLNKKAIGWVDLVILLLTIIAIIAVIIYLVIS